MPRAPQRFRIHALRDSNTVHFPEGGHISTCQVISPAYLVTSEYALIVVGPYLARIAESACGDRPVEWPGFNFAPDTVTILYLSGAVSNDTLTILPVTTRASRSPASPTPEAGPADAYGTIGREGLSAVALEGR